MKILIRGAGDLASGVAWRLYQAGYKKILMTDIAVPTTVRRTVAFSPAIYQGEATVEGVTGRLVTDEAGTEAAHAAGEIAVIADPGTSCLAWFKPDVLVDGILAKYNTGTKIDDADLVLGKGPGFTAKVDVDFAIETKRGHYLGRIISEGSPVPDTGVPGNIAGFTSERIIRAGADGVFKGLRKIGDLVKAGEELAVVKTENGAEVVTYANIAGVVRGMLQDGVQVTEGMKSGDVDPRGEVDYCRSISDKSLAIGGGVLQAVSKYAHEHDLEK